MKVLIGLLALLGILGSSAGYYFFGGADGDVSPYRTSTVERGKLRAVVSATGTVEPEDVVDVGAQVQVATRIKGFGRDLDDSSRTIDFRSRVEEGTLLAMLDEDHFRSQRDQATADVETGKANCVRAEADLLQMQAKLNQAERDWVRARKLGPSKGVISELDYDASQATFESAKSVLAVGRAGLLQAQKGLQKAEAALKQAEIELGYCTVRSPVNGVIIDRRVNVGQTVVSSLNASSLFLIAKDLKKLEVWAAVNEADIGSIRKGQKVRFSVDAFPDESFHGIVKQVRLNAQMTQNVVTYPVVVSTDNDSGKLLPYLTANLQFELKNLDNVLLVPNGALRWRPQMQQVHPEHREKAQEFFQRKKSAITPNAAGTSGPEKERSTQGIVWVAQEEFVRPIKVRTGLTDGSKTEVNGELTEGMEVVIGTTTTAAAASDGTVNPFQPQMKGSKRGQ